MRCDKCGNKAVFFQSYSGRHLCGKHLVRDIETRAKRSIRSHRWMRPGDNIGVAISGDRKSAALLRFMQKLTADRRDIRLSAVPAFREECGTADRSAAMTVVESLGIPWGEMPLPDGSGSAGKDAITTVAMAVTLDDIAQGMLEQFLFGNADRLVHPSLSQNGPLPVIFPFIAIPVEELDFYWAREGPKINLPFNTPPREKTLKETEKMLEDYYRRHPATKYALLHLAEELSDGNIAGIAAVRSTGQDDFLSRNILQGVDGYGI